MPTKKTETKENSFDIQKLMQDSDSYKSLIYGIVTVIVLFIVVALGIRTLQQNKAEIDQEAISTQSETQKMQDTGYTVQEGETLWSIAEKTYGDGFKWQEIAKANNITDASSLEKGTKLVMPKLSKDTSVAVAQPTMTPEPTKVTENISVNALPEDTNIAPTSIPGNEYTVQKGDYLWEIAIRAYGDGYRWVDIAKANHLENPDLIFSGNTLNLPRP